MKRPKYKKFAQAAHELVNSDHTYLDLLDWCERNLVNEHGMVAIWEAQKTMETMALFGSGEETEYDVSWGLVFPNLEKVLEKYGVAPDISGQKELCKLTKTTYTSLHGYYGDAQYFEIKFIDSYDLYKFIFNK